MRRTSETRPCSGRIAKPELAQFHEFIERVEVEVRDELLEAGSPGGAGARMGEPLKRRVLRFCNGVTETAGNSGQQNQHRIKIMRFGDAPGNAVKYLEVLAGAISWGFKSPSPRHIRSRCRSLTRRLLSFLVISSSFRYQFGLRRFCDVICAKLGSCSLARYSPARRPASWVSVPLGNSSHEE